jgi:hypothetical protein
LKIFKGDLTEKPTIDQLASHFKEQSRIIDEVYRESERQLVLDLATFKKEDIQMEDKFIDKYLDDQNNLLIQQQLPVLKHHHSMPPFNKILESQG